MPFQSVIMKNAPCDQQKTQKKILAMEISCLFIFLAEILPIQWFNSHTLLRSVTQGVQAFFLSLSWDPEKELGLYSEGFLPLLYLFFLSNWENTEILMWGVYVDVCCYSEPCDPLRGHVVSTAETEKCTLFFWFMSNERRVDLFASIKKNTTK